MLSLSDGLKLSLKKNIGLNFLMVSGVMEKQLYRNHTSAWEFSCKFAAYFQSIFPKEHLCTAASEDKLLRGRSHITSSLFWPFWTPPPPLISRNHWKNPPPELHHHLNKSPHILKDLEIKFRSISDFQSMENSRVLTNVNSTFFVSS